MPFGNYDDQDNDPVNAARKRTVRTLSGNTLRSNFPAANQVSNPRNTAFARNAPVNTIAQNLTQIPNNYQPGSIYGNLRGALAQSFTNPYAALFNQVSQNQQSQQNQPTTLTGYHWTAGTGGVSGGNNANADLTWSNGTRTNMISPLGGLPALGSTQSTPQPQYPQAPQQYPTIQQGNVNYNVPGGSMQDALQKMAPAGMDYNAGTGQWIPQGTVSPSPLAGSASYISPGVASQRTASGGLIPGVQKGSTVITTPTGGTIVSKKPWLGGGY